MSDTSVVIVAVPSNAETLPGPEDKHCTLQYLGKIGDTAAPTLEDSMMTLARAVSEAAANCQPFELPVDHIGPLGDDGAQVWFLDDTNGLMGQLRDRVLAVPEVQALVNAGSFTKHPDFIPHVTVGYNVEQTPEIQAVTSIPFYAVALWWGDVGMLFPLGSLASAQVASESLTQLAIIDVHGNWHHPYTGKFVRKPWEFDGTLKALFPEDVTSMVDELTKSPKGSSWEDIYRLRKNLRQLAKDPTNEHLIDASWSKVADLRERYSLATVKNTDRDGKPKQDGLPTMEAVDAVMDLVEEGLEYLETAWLYDNYGADENPDQEMLPLEPQEWVAPNETPHEEPSAYALEQDAVADRMRFLAIMDVVHRVRRSNDALALPDDGAPKTFAPVRKKPIDGPKLSQAVEALASLGDTAGVNAIKALARNGNRGALNGFIDNKVQKLEKVSKALDQFISAVPEEYPNPYDDASPTHHKKDSRSDSQRSHDAKKAAETRKKHNQGKDQKRAPAGSATGGQWVDDPSTAANKAGGGNSSKAIRKALENGHVAKAQKIAQAYLHKVTRALDKLYSLTFANAGTMLASGANQEVTMTKPVLGKWEGPLGFEGQFTGDNRMIAPGALTWGETFPQPFRWAAEDIGAHDGARVIGTIEGMSRLEEPMEWEGQTLPVGTIFGWGTFDLMSELGQEAQRHVDQRLSNGVSLDLDKVSAEMLDAATCATELGMSLDDAIEDRAVTLIRGARNRAATLVALPAFEGARIKTCAKWTHETTPVSAEKLRATLVSLATEGVGAFAGIRIDAGGHWGVTVPNKGYRWVDMPNIALGKLDDLVHGVEYDEGSTVGERLGNIPEVTDQVKAAFDSPDADKIEAAQHAVQDILDNFPFEDYHGDSVKGYDDEDTSDNSVEAIQNALEAFVAQDPHDVVDTLTDKAADAPSKGTGLREASPGDDSFQPIDSTVGPNGEKALERYEDGAGNQILKYDADTFEKIYGDSKMPEGKPWLAESADGKTSKSFETREEAEAFLTGEPAANADDQGAELPKSDREPLNPYMTQDDASLQRNLEILQEDLVAAQKKAKKNHTPENTREINQIVKEKAALEAEIERRQNAGVGTDAEGNAAPDNVDLTPTGSRAHSIKGKLESKDEYGGTSQGYIEDLDAANSYLQDHDMTQFLDEDLKGVVTKLEWSIPADDPSSWTVDVETSRPLTQEEADSLKSFIEGQNSDGLGEGFEQQPFAENDEESGIYIAGEGPFDTAEEANAQAEEIYRRETGNSADDDETEYESWLDENWEEVDPKMTSLRGDVDVSPLIGSTSAEIKGDLEETSGTKSGRGPNGKVRNFKAMGDAKFEQEAAKVLDEDNDSEAIAAVKAEQERRAPLDEQLDAEQQRVQGLIDGDGDGKVNEVEKGTTEADEAAKGGAPDWFVAGWDEGPAQVDKYYSDLLVSTDHLGEDQEKFLKQAAESGLTNGGYPPEYIAAVSQLWMDPKLDGAPVNGDGIQWNNDTVAPVTAGEGAGGVMLINSSGEHTVWFESLDAALAAAENSPEDWISQGGREFDGMSFLGLINLTTLTTETFNWVEETGGLPKYIRDIADELIKKGMTESHAIATAVNTVKRWARAGSAAKGQKGHVGAKTVAKAIAALAEWEAKRAAANATAVQADVVSKFGDESILADIDPLLFEEIAGSALTVVNDILQETGQITPGTREPRDLEADVETLDESIQQVQEAKAIAVRHNKAPRPGRKRGTERVVRKPNWPPAGAVKALPAESTAAAADETLVASGGTITINGNSTGNISAWATPPASDYDRETVALLASGAGTRALAAPIKPPREWFEDPKFRGGSPLTVTKEGRVFGHLALWGSCHTGFDGQCLMVPRSASDYALFHLGVVECEDGSEVAVGRLAMNTGHANDTYGSRKAIAHYENTGLAIADLRAGEDQFGIWVAGALRPDATPEQIRALKASPLSGDWRHNPATGSLDLVMALAVNQPGFAVPRPKFLVASGAVRTLTAAGMVAPAKVSKIKVQRALAGDATAAADIRYLQKLANEARRKEAQQLRAKVLESTGARRKIKEMAASLALLKEES